MADRVAKFHLAWFTNALPHGWMNGKPSPWAGNDLTRWMTGEFLIDMAKALDRARFCCSAVRLRAATSLKSRKGWSRFFRSAGWSGRSTNTPTCATTCASFS